VDLKELGLQEGKSAWKVHVSCVVLNHEGNIVDACLLGAVSALLDLRLPLVKFGTKNGKEIVQLLGTNCDQSKSPGTMNDGRKGIQLNLKTIPIPLTVGIFENKMLVDPTMEEEEVCDGMITVIVDALSLKGDDDVYDGKILGLSKSGEAILKPEDIAACAQLAMGRARELRNILIAK
jgi:exosome complex RNA-binding protein Rrp42 (RNase PH superfamily)